MEKKIYGYLVNRQTSNALLTMVPRSVMLAQAKYIAEVLVSRASGRCSPSTQPAQLLLTSHRRMLHPSPRIRSDPKTAEFHDWP